MKRIKCKSGIMGWQCRLRDNYASFKEFKAWSIDWGIHVRLGYKSPETAWRHNPIVQGSVIPSDLKRSE